jgi:predicted DNA-binding transcriptional regulator YafY
MYENADYSISNMPLTNQDINKLNEAVDILKQFSQFNHFKDICGLLNKLENKIELEINNNQIIHIDKNENLKGIDKLNQLYKIIQKKESIIIEYKSFKSRNANKFVYIPLILKEYNNRWFLVGHRENSEYILNLALDRIIDYKPNKNSVKRIENFNPDQYYEHVLGVTVNKGILPRKIILSVKSGLIPYILTKPIHHSQKLIEKKENEIIISLKLAINFELERVILGFGNEIEVISPPSLRNKIIEIIENNPYI